MHVLNALAQAAAVILLFELLVVLIVFAGIAGGLAFGLRWARGKTDWAFDKVNAVLPLATKYVHRGTDYVAKPIILAGGFAETVKETAESIRRRVRSMRQSREPAAPVASFTTSPAEQVTVAVPAAVDVTASMAPVTDDTVVVVTPEAPSEPSATSPSS